VHCPRARAGWPHTWDWCRASEGWTRRSGGTGTDSGSGPRPAGAPGSSARRLPYRRSTAAPHVIVRSRSLVCACWPFSDSSASPRISTRRSPAAVLVIRSSRQDCQSSILLLLCECFGGIMTVRYLWYLHFIPKKYWRWNSCVRTDTGLKVTVWRLSERSRYGCENFS
jgi:hypothetical protein